MTATHKQIHGPWEVDTIDNEGDYGDGGPDCRSGFKSYAVFDAKGRVLFDSLNRDTRVTEIHEEIDDERRYAWDELARIDLTLAAEAPAMRLALDMICAGVALVATCDESGREYIMLTSTEQTFDLRKTWTETIAAIGWDFCLEALAAARGGV